MVILSPQLTEAEVTSVCDEIKGQLGEVTYEDHWGKRKFAYPINKHADGFYAVWNFRLSQDQIVALKDFLRLHQSVLRNLIVHIPEDYQPITGKQLEEGLDTYYEELKKDKKKPKAEEKPKAEVKVEDTSTSSVPAGKVEAEEAEEPAVPAEPEEVKEPAVEEPIAPSEAEVEPEIKSEPEPEVEATPEEKPAPAEPEEAPAEEEKPAEEKKESQVDSKLDEKLKSIFEDELSF
jgi:ribosomal protein S6